MPASPISPKSPVWTFAGRTLGAAAVPRLMGILNVTPDSFSDGGRWQTLDAAIEQGERLAADGAAVLDVGGESTRPGAAPVDPVEERRRVEPVIEQLARRLSIPISVDTRNASVARAALDAGATIVNDVSAGLHDPQMLPLWAGCDCGLVLMHMQGTPETMQIAPHYGDVVREVGAFLATRVDACQQAGIDARRIVLDPGIGFGKTAEHNVSLLTHVDALRSHNRPLLIGHSRKRFLYKLLGRETDERLAGTLGVSIALASRGVDYLRVHDIRALRDALRAWWTLASPEPVDWTAEP